MSDETSTEAPVAATPKRTRTKPPARTVSGDNYTVTVDGQTYYPHYGEVIRFGSSIRVDTMLAAMQLQELRSLQDGDATPEAAANAREAFVTVSNELSKAILDWTWTDEQGNNYPSKPSPENIRSLPIDEMMWVVGGAFGGAEATEGEASTS